MSQTTTALELDPVVGTLPNATTVTDITVQPIIEDDATRAITSTDAPPDGGYGWVVVAACSIITWWVIGTSYSWGIIQAALVEDSLSNAATWSFVGSLAVALISVLGIANARLIYDDRREECGGDRRCLSGCWGGAGKLCYAQCGRVVRYHVGR
jgi:hypothetical protein